MGWGGSGWARPGRRTRRALGCTEPGSPPPRSSPMVWCEHPPHLRSSLLLSLSLFIPSLHRGGGRSPPSKPTLGWHLPPLCWRGPGLDRGAWGGQGVAGSVLLCCASWPPQLKNCLTPASSLSFVVFVALLSLQLTKLHQLAMQQSHFPMSHGNTGFSGTAPPPLPLSPALAEGGAQALRSKPTQITQTKHFPPSPARPGNAVLPHRPRGRRPQGVE